jgi:UTP--glucose-1-phosphate uridylyltransferase
MASRVTKAVIPAAGLGTRFVPASKAVPKELLPVVDVPAIEYVVAEAAAAGLDDIVMVSNRGKTLLEDHFDRAPELEAALEKKGDTERLARVQRSSKLATLHFVRQGEPRGLGHAVLCGAHHVGDQRFAVLLGDDLIDERDPVLPRMLELQEKYGGSVVLLMEVPREQTQLYGCSAVEPTDTTDVVRITDLVEKPDPAEAPSNLAVIGRYVLDPAVFDVLRETPPGRGNEIQLTDALRTLATRDRDAGGPVHGLVFRGRRYDTGDRADYLKAIVRLAWERQDLGPEFREWLREFVAGNP